MVNTQPFFSIVIPVFNRESLIAQTIQSVLDQQFTDFELIIVDDGSTDKTEDQVQSFSDPRILYIKIKNSERAAARNEGARQSKGTYLNFFDSDDLMYTHHLSTAHEFSIKNKNPQWFHVGYNICDEQGRLLTREKGTSDPPKKLIQTNYLGCDSVFIDRKFFLENQFNEDRRLASSEDWELWLRVISKNPLMTCAEVTFRMIQHDNRSLTMISPDRVIERDTFMLQVLMQNEAFKEKFNDDLLLFEADRYTFFALSLIVVKRRAEAISYLWKSLMATPRVTKRKRFWACIKLIMVAW